MPQASRKAPVAAVSLAQGPATVSNFICPVRQVDVLFSETRDGVRVIETLEADDEYTAEQKREGWPGILNHLKKYVESQ